MTTTKLPPLCRCCGKPIPRSTKVLFFNSRSMPTRFSRDIDEKPKTLEEAQKHSNDQIIKVRWSTSDKTDADRYVEKAFTWDGETHTDKYFCKNPCAMEFAYAVARSGYVSAAYTDGVDAQLAAQSGANTYPRKKP